MKAEPPDGMTRKEVHGAFWMSMVLSIVGIALGIAAAGVAIGHFFAWVWIRLERTDSGGASE